MRRHVDDASWPPGRRARGFHSGSAGAIRCGVASKQALQECRCFGETAGARQAGRLEHIVGVRKVVHVQSFLCSETTRASSRGSPTCLPVYVAGESRWRRAHARIMSAGPSDEGPHTILSARAALTAALAWSAPSTLTEAIAARASSGVTSMAMLASPSTWMWSVSPAARTVSRLSRV